MDIWQVALEATSNEIHEKPALEPERQLQDCQSKPPPRRI